MLFKPLSADFSSPLFECNLNIALGLTLLRLHIIAEIFREWLLALSQYGEIATVGFQALCHYTCNDIQIIRVLLSSGQPLR